MNMSPAPARRFAAMPFAAGPASFDAAAGVARLTFAYPGHHEFTETIDFGVPPAPMTVEQVEAVHHILPFLSAAAAISYYKAFMPAYVDSVSMGPDTARFFKKFYQGGLGEFAYRNDIDISGYSFFKADGKDVAANPVALPRRSAVMIGGGKDSLVSIETLRASGENMVLLAVNPAKPIRECIAASGLPAITITRKIDPRLFALNEQGAYNGHVPITGILSFVAAAAAIIHGFDTIILSNERSANEPTVGDVNHQYSKSAAFERDFQTFIHAHMLTHLNYFSLLRPMSELNIAQAMARETRYDDVFTSCNKAYSITRPMVDQRWCGECPKCLFVFLALATAMPVDRLVNIFGKNVLNDAALLGGYRELSGLAGQKPWECVGEILESAAALYHLSTLPAWQDFMVVETLRSELETQYGVDRLQDAYQTALTFSDDHDVPDIYLKTLKSHAG